LVELCPGKASVPAVTVRVQGLRLALLRVWATQLRPTFRPLRSWVKLKLTEACSFSEKEKVVPVGTRLLLLIRASALPSRQREAD
jgi:hypothetical protein